MDRLLAMIATVAVAQLFGPCNARAYEFSTHAAISREAFVRWSDDPANSDAFERLGLALWQHFLGASYVDMGSEVEVRAALPRDDPEFAKRHLESANRLSGFRPTLDSAAGWLMLGAIREDDVPFDPGALENTPQDDPEGPFTRVVSHFYDPYTDRPLTREVALGPSAPDWALTPGKHPVARFEPPGFEERGNHYNLPAAREAMWRAATLKRFADTGELVDAGPQLPKGPTGAQLSVPEDLRKAYWATTFRALGDVVHLLQDMAQPQHTRNDAHAGLGCVIGSCMAGHASYYEGYIEARATGGDSFQLRERFFTTSDPRDVVVGVRKPALSYDGYPLVRLPGYRQYFSVGSDSGGSAGQGIADYSNRGFYSAGTNIPSTIHPSPPSFGDGLADDLIPNGSAKDAAGGDVKGSLFLLRGNVADKLRPERHDGDAVALTSIGAFDRFLSTPVKNGRYSLTHYNYDDQARLLIPRAVGYSAGLLDYFFRGRMEISPPEEGVYAVIDQKAQGCKDACGFARLKLKVRNTTPGEDMSSGKLVAIARFHRNLCYQPDLSGDPGGPNFAGSTCRGTEEEIVVSDPVALARLATDEETAFQFTFAKPIPVNASDIILQVAYRGKLGAEEDAVVLMTRDIAEPNRLAIVNSTDYAFDDAGDGRYHRLPYKNIAGPAVLQALTLAFGSAAPIAARLDAMDGAQHAQVAFLADKGSYHFKVWAGALLDAANPAVEFIQESPEDPYRRTIPFVIDRGWRRDTLIFMTWSTLTGSVTSSTVCAPAESGGCNTSGLTTLSEADVLSWAVQAPFAP